MADEKYENARSGRTTGIVLSAIGKACLNPIKWVPVRDHVDLNSVGRKELIANIKARISLLELDFEVRTDCSKTIIIRSMKLPEEPAPHKTESQIIRGDSMDSNNTSTCCTCGFSWLTGMNGSHSCSSVLKQHLDELKVAQEKRVKYLQGKLNKIYEIATAGHSDEMEMGSALHDISLNC